MKIGLLFGSFDPIHKGHSNIAEWALNSSLCDEVWFVLSPKNPMKPNVAAPYEHRKNMVELAISGVDRLKLSTIESELTAPHYTIHTIEELKRRHPEAEFLIFCGSDVKKQSENWHRATELHSMVEFVEYPRYSNDKLPFIDISSTEIRQGLKGEMLNIDVSRYAQSNRIYNPALERGKALYAEGDICGAINEWSNLEGTDEQKKEAAALRELASEILAYRYTEIYNP